jgi:hypothetical protein
MEHVIQFPDLAEVFYLQNTYYRNGVTIEDINTIKTEFIFNTMALTQNNGYAKKLGFLPVSCMNNWWSSHKGEKRRMTLYWMRNPNFTGEPQVAKRVRWNYTGNDENIHIPRAEIGDYPHLAASGCGFKIGNAPFSAKLFHRFFTVMRLPLEIDVKQKRWLKAHNFRHLDTGQLASYYVNGWKPDEYSVKEEFKYFGVDAGWNRIKKEKVNGDRQQSSEPIQNVPPPVV